MIEDWEKRVLKEREQLEERISKLMKFMETEICTNLPPQKQVLLDEQLQVMSEYDRILTERLKP